MTPAGPGGRPDPGGLPDPGGRPSPGGTRAGGLLSRGADRPDGAGSWLEIPQRLRQAAGACSPADGAGARWLAALPETVRRLAALWHLDVGPVYPESSQGLSVQVRRANRPAVLKIPLPDGENADQPLALRVYAGEGAARLYEHDQASGALLVEYAPGAPLSSHPDGDAAGLLALCDLLRQLRREPPPGLVLPRVADVAEDWSRLLCKAMDLLPEPSRPLIATAAGLAEGYAAAPLGADYLINRAVHPGNVLAADREPWLLIKPTPIVGEAAFEAGYPLLDRLGVASDTAAAAGGGAPVPLAGGWGPFGVDHLLGAPGTPQRAVELAALLGRGLGVDPQRVRGWALIRTAVGAVTAASRGQDPGPHLARAAALDAAGAPDRSLLHPCRG